MIFSKLFNDYKNNVIIVSIHSGWRYNFIKKSTRRVFPWAYAFIVCSCGQLRPGQTILTMVKEKKKNARLSLEKFNERNYKWPSVDVWIHYVIIYGESIDAITTATGGKSGKKKKTTTLPRTATRYNMS